MTPRYKVGDIIETPKGNIGEILTVDGDWTYEIFWHLHKTRQGEADCWDIPMVDSRSKLAGPNWQTVHSVQTTAPQLPVPQTQGYADGAKLKTAKGNIFQVVSSNSGHYLIKWLKHDKLPNGKEKLYTRTEVETWGARFYDEKFIEGPPQEPVKHKCKCEIRVIMMVGCQCGGI